MPTTAERGYGTEHKKLRRLWAVRVNAGEVDCARCGKRLQPGQPWDLDHDDRDRTRYNGPACVPCNRATSGRHRVQQKRWSSLRW